MGMRAVALVLMLAASSPAAGQMPLRSEVSLQIAKAWKGFTDAWLAGNAPAATKAFFTQEAINIVPDAPQVRGRAAIDSSFMNFQATSKVLSMAQTTDEIEVSGTIAYERGHFTQVTQQGRAPSQIVTARYLAVWT